MSTESVSTLPHSISSWPEEERPREKLIRHGAEYLSDSELLAILLRSGTRRANALDCARALLKRFSSLTGLGRRSYQELAMVDGIGAAKAVTLLAACEIGRRRHAGLVAEPTSLTSPQDVARQFIPKLQDLRVERFYVLLLDTASHLIREVPLSQGTVNASIVHPREVFRAAVLDHAASIILLHNHPSGTKMASAEDRQVTRTIVAAGEMMGIPVVDHLIVCGSEFFSFAENGLI